MTFVDASGNVLNKTELLALTTQLPVVDPDRKFTATVYETYSLSGEGSHQMGKRKKFKTGDVISQAKFDAMFDAATVTSISPATGPAAGGTAFTLTGTHLSGVEGVTFGGVAATNVKVVSDTKVTGVTPPHAAGAVSVVVSDDSGNVTKTNFYTYT